LLLPLKKPNPLWGNAKAFVTQTKSWTRVFVRSCTIKLTRI
jgi:hypothetical protein